MENSKKEKRTNGKIKDKQLRLLQGKQIPKADSSKCAQQELKNKVQYEGNSVKHSGIAVFCTWSF